MNKSYFQQLRQEFKKSPYQDRFLQEIQDHAQDLESELPKSQKLTPDFMKKQFGEPKEVKKIFTQITRPWLKTQQAWEAIGIGLLCLVGIFIGSMLLSWITGAIASLFSSGMAQDLAVSLNFLSPILTFIFSYFIYRWTWIHLKNKQGESLWTERQIIAFVLSPISLILLGFILQFILGRGDAIFLLFGFFVLLVALLARLRLPLNKSKKKSRKIKWSWATLFFILIFVYVLVFSLFRMLNIQLEQSVYATFFMFIDGFEFFILAVLPLLISGSILTSSYITIGLLLASFLFALGWMILKKRWSWVSGAVMIYIVSTLFVSYDSFYHGMEFSVPSQRLSATIEQNQFGPFYGFLKENYNDLEDAFYYQIDFKEGQFILDQIERGSIARQFSFDPNKGWPKDIFSSKERFKHEVEEYESNLDTLNNWPEDLNCQRPVGIEGMSGFDTCLSLSFKGRELINSLQFSDDLSYGMPFVGAVLSPDKNWLLLRISPTMSPTAVFLLDFTQINSPSHE